MDKAMGRRDNTTGMTWQYDVTAGQMYLRNGGTIYRTPLYTLQEMDRFATGVRDCSRWFRRIG